PVDHGDDTDGSAGDGGAGDGGGGTGGEEAGDGPVSIFTDECAGPEPGSDPAEDCPEGAGGTVLALTEPWPQWVLFFPERRAGGWSSRCSTDPVGANEIPATVVTLNPGTIQLEYWPDGDPAAVTTVERSTADEADPEHQLWRGWFEDSTLNLENHKRVQYCLVLGDLSSGSYRYRVTSTDIFGSSSVDEGWFAGPDERSRPPVTIRARDDTLLRVLVPVRSGANETAVILGVPQSGPDASTCAAVEAAGWRSYPIRGRTHSIGTSDAVDVDGGRGSASYPWDPNYDRVTRKMVSIDEGTTTSICIWWVSGPRRSFDASRVNEREEHLVTAPNRYRARVSVESMTFTQFVDTADVVVRVGSTGPDPCGSRVRVLDEDVRATGDEATAVVLDRLVCDLTEVGDVGAIGDSIDVHVQGRELGTPETTRLDLSRLPCAGGVCEPEHTDWYRLNIPGARGVRSVGVMLLRVDLVDGPAEGGDDYSFGTPAPFDGSDVDPPDPPPYPRLDIYTGVTPIAGRHDALQVVANLDRPATVRVFPVWSDLPWSPEPCLLPGGTGAAVSPAPAANHVFVIERLCAGHRYDFGVEMTDTLGNVSYAVGPDALDSVPEPRMPWLYPTASVPLFEAAVDARLVLLTIPEDPGSTGSVVYTRSHVSLGGGFPLPGIHRAGCVGRTLNLVSPGPTHNSLSNQVEIEVDVEAAVAVHISSSGSRAYCEASGPVARTTLRATVPIEALQAGPIVLTSPAEDSLQVEVTITATVS
ncbi:MAG: hypothetical protein ACRDZV_07450, partial [Acidimicrobiia bacterium]